MSIAEQTLQEQLLKQCQARVLFVLPVVDLRETFPCFAWLFLGSRSAWGRQKQGPSATSRPLRETKRMLLKQWRFLSQVYQVGPILV